MKFTKITIVVVVIALIWAFSYKMGWNAAVTNAELIDVTEEGYDIQYTPSNVHHYTFTFEAETRE